ncbi:MAG: O-antigen ligase family protein [Gammaproteobacteria bacterium]|nr:O-antigen ligase family protein [Gammaproteobacteria bacterium]MBV8404241.1 O-antigen ligase family protein [Gammaproteobacteria bacterium]
MSAVNGQAVTRRIRRRVPAKATGAALSLIGLFIFTFFLVTARFPSLFTEVGIYLALLGLVLRPQEVGFPTPMRWATALMLWGLVTSFTAIAPELAWPALIELLKALVIFFVVMNVLRTPQQLRSYILLFLVAFAVYPGRGAILNYITGNLYFGRTIWNGIYSNPNDLAAITLLVLGLALSIATVKTQNRRVRQAAIAFVPMTVLIILLTQSRGTFLGLLVGFGPTILSRVRKRPTVAGPVLVVVVLAAVLVPATAWHRFEDITKVTSSETIGEADKYGSAQQRFEILKNAWHIVEDHPLLGVGIGCYNEANAIYSPSLGKRDAHNTYVLLAAEMGFPGLLLWLGLVWSVLAEVRRRWRVLEADVGVIQILWLQRAIVGCLVAAFFASYFAITLLYLLLGTLWAAARVLGNDTVAGHALQGRQTPRARSAARAAPERIGRSGRRALRNR